MVNFSSEARISSVRFSSVARRLRVCVIPPTILCAFELHKRHRRRCVALARARELACWRVMRTLARCCYDGAGWGGRERTSHEREVVIGRIV